jgi:hypothetical protein
VSILTWEEFVSEVHSALVERATSHNEKFSEKEAANYIGLSPSSLRRRRAARTGPDFVQIDRMIHYRRHALDDYIESHTVRCSRAQ